MTDKNTPESPEVRNNFSDPAKVPQYSVWCEIFTWVKTSGWKWFKILVLGFIILKFVCFAPMLTLYTFVGAMFFAIPTYVIVKKFFPVPYYRVYTSDLDLKKFSAYDIPQALFKKGEWEFVGTPKKFSRYIEYEGDVAEINKIAANIQKIDVEIAEINKIIEEIKLKIVDFEGKRNFVKKFKRAVKKTRGLEKPNFKNYATVKETYLENKEYYLDLKDELRDLKREKNELLESLSFEGEGAGVIYFADKIDWANKQVIFSDVHLLSDIDYLLDSEAFNKANAIASENYKNFVQLKKNQKMDVLSLTAKLVTQYMKDLDPTVSEQDVDILDKELKEESLFKKAEMDLLKIAKGDADGNDQESNGTYPA